jgi:hypothetical protein
MYSEHQYPTYVKCIYDIQAPLYLCNCKICIITKKEYVHKISYFKDPRLIDCINTLNNFLNLTINAKKNINKFKKLYNTFQKFISLNKSFSDLYDLFTRNKYDIKFNLYVIEKQHITNLNDLNLLKSKITNILPNKFNNKKYYELIPINYEKTIFNIKDLYLENSLNNEIHEVELSIDFYKKSNLCTDYIYINKIYNNLKIGNSINNLNILNNNVYYLEINNHNKCAWIKLELLRSNRKLYIQDMFNEYNYQLNNSSLIRYTPY